MEFDDEDAVDKIVLLGLHVIKGVRLAAKKSLNKEQIRGGGGRGRSRDRDFRGRAGLDRGWPSGSSGGWGDRDRGRDRGDRSNGGGRDMVRGMGGRKPGDKSMAMMSSMRQMNMCNQMMVPGEARAGRGWDQSYHGQAAGPSRGHPQGYSSGGGSFGGGGAEVPSNSAYPPANSYSEAGPTGQAPYYGAGSSSGGYTGYRGQGQGGYSGFSSLGQTWSSGQGGAAKGGGGPLMGHQRYTRGANRYDPYARH